MKSMYSTILSSNNLGISKLFKDWMEIYGYSSGVKMKLNKDNQIEIYGDPSSHIVISKLPPTHIKYIEDVERVYFMNLRFNEESLMPEKYINCGNVEFEYCVIPKSYKDKHPKVKYLNCKFI